jgi:putative ABC transport system substrate-binding protein
MTNRREFITLLGGAAAAWPLAARAQQRAQSARIGWADFAFEDDRDGWQRLQVFQESLQKLGWVLGRNLVMDYRWGIFEADSARRAAADLLALAPDAIICTGTPAADALRQASSTVPVVFTSVSEPVAQGIVDSLAHPGRNLTGFSYMEPTMGAKWLDLLKEIKPDVEHAVLLFNPDSSPYARLFYQSIRTATARSGVEVIQAPVHDLNDIDAVVAMLQTDGHGGLIVAPEGFTYANRKSIAEIVAKYRVPAVYGGSAAFDGGLLHYRVDINDQNRAAAGYVDRILRGANPADLPVQQPTKFELVINLKTAKAIGLTVPPSLLARADEVIE